MGDAQRTAIVTGARKRIGAQIASAFVQRGWTVLAHVRSDSDSVPNGTVKVAADLADPDCAVRIFSAAAELPPVRLLVNNAARFAWDGFGEFSVEEFDSHMRVNVRAPLLLIEEMARRGDGDALVVNLLDSKLSAPNADFLSYTISKQALLGVTELAARALASKGIRVNAIAPGLMLKSQGQSEENYRVMHSRNPLGRGVTAEDVIGAIDYFIAAPAVTGEVLTIDGGHRFTAPGRDLQFLEP
jgi:NAD(P)-dependent dehydrogenase (short-subunit alcohol dehydrogenase family)